MPNNIELLKTKYKNKPNIFVNPHGLGSQTKEFETGDANLGNGFSITQNHGFDRIKVKTVSALEFFNDNNIGMVDVCKINIEGAEYDLLEHMIENGLHLKCRNLQIQFHAQYPVPNWYNRYEAIREAFSKSHHLTFDFYMVWENWTLSNMKD